MGFFSKEKPVDVAEPVTNPRLKNAITIFKQDKTEANLKRIVDSIKQANFLVLIYRDGLIVSKSETNKTIFETGSKIKFLNVVDRNNNSYLPILTDWNEVDLWLKTRENIGGWIMTAKEIFDFISKREGYKGIVINPATDGWTMQLDQIRLFVKENY